MEEELINLRIDQLPLNGGLKGTYFLAIRNMDTQKTERVPLSEFGIGVTTQNFEWITDNDPGYAEDEVVTYGGKWWQSLINDNLNITPGTNPLAWVELAKSPSSLAFWQAGVYSTDEVIVLYDNGTSVEFYRLVDPARPFVSDDFDAELIAGDWELISGGQSHFKGVFASEAALELAFPIAEPGDYALVDVGSADAQLFIWDDTDTDWIASGVTTVVPNASETVAGITEEATDAEMTAGTTAGGTGARLFVNPAKLLTWFATKYIAWTAALAGVVELSTTAEAQNIVTRAAAGSSDASNSDARTPSEKGLVEMLLSFITTAWTWTLKQTFTLAPRFSSTTATTFLGVDSNKDLVSIPEATQAEMITGTAQNRLATPKSVEDKGSVKSRTITNGATGITDIDCLSQQQCKIVFNVTITGAAEITKSNASNLELLNITVPVTGSSIAITFPSDTRMDRIFEGGVWNQTTKVFTATAIGTADLFEFSLMKIGSVYELRYGGPSRA